LVTKFAARIIYFLVQGTEFLVNQVFRYAFSFYARRERVIYTYVVYVLL